MDTLPAIEHRGERDYVARRVVMQLRDFGERIPVLMGELCGWMQQHNVTASGAMFLRFHTIDMPERIDVEAALPVDGAPQPEDDISTGTVPAGRYATLIYTGVENAVAQNRRLIDWIAAQGETMDYERRTDGDQFAARIETLMSDPEDLPAQSQWQIAIKLR